MLDLRTWVIAAAMLAIEIVSNEARAAAPEPATQPAPAAAASEAAEAGPSDPAYLEARRKAKRARKREAGDSAGAFERGGCMNDPKKCTCQSENAAESHACGDVLGYFCPDSTQRLLMAQCVDLFGGATMCKCASKDEIAVQVAKDDAAAAAAAKAAEKKKKKGKGKKPSK